MRTQSDGEIEKHDTELYFSKGSGMFLKEPLAFRGQPERASPESPAGTVALPQRIPLPFLTNVRVRPGCRRD